MTSFLKRSLAMAGIAGLTVAGAHFTMQAPAVAEDEPMATSADAAIVYRKNVMSGIGSNAQAMVAITKGDIRNDDAFSAHADMLAIAADLTIDAFRQNTHGEGRERTTAKENVWTDWDGFRRGFNGLAERATVVADFAANGNMDAARAAMPDLMKACKACHEDFRTR
ncbi:MAG: cytochrome c [Sphingomonadales bacterium]